MQLPLLKVCGSFLFRQSKKTRGIPWSVRVFFCISRGQKTKQIRLVRGKFSFLYADIWFDVTKCKFIMKNSGFNLLFVFQPIFVVDTKITFAYYFVAPLSSRSSEQLLKKTEQPMAMSSMEKQLSYVKVTLIFERFCHVSRFATLREGSLRELKFADQKFYKNSQIVNFLKNLRLFLELILIM